MAKTIELDMKPEFFPWNEEEFQSDLRVRGMTKLQRWMYRTLLQSAFWTSTRPLLPSCDTELWVLADCESLEQWHQNKAAVLRCFHKVPGRPLLENKRVMKCWEVLVTKRKRMQELSRLAAEKRSATGRPPDGVPTDTVGTPSAVEVKVKEKVKESEVAPKGAVAPFSFLSADQEQELTVKLKDFVKRCVPIWQNYFGEGAVLRLPTLCKQDVEFMTSAYKEKDLLAAFDLYAKHQFTHAQHDPFAVGKFMSKVSDYMLLVKPAKTSDTLEVQNKQAADQYAKRNAIPLLTVPAQQKSEPLSGGIEDFLDKE